MEEIRPDIWMPITWGDYARATGHLNAAMHGAYLMLIKHYWCSGSPLPDDDVVLWRVACCDSIGQWKKMRVVIVSFFQVADGVWRHRRIDKELAAAKERARKAHARGKAGANARWKDGACLKDAPSIDQASTEHAQSNAQAMASHKHNHSNNSEDKSSDGAPSAGKALWDEGVAYLTSHGNTERNARSLIGGWRKKHGDERTHAGIKAAKEQDVSEPVAWIIEWLKAPQNAAPPRTAEEAMAQISGWKGLA